VQEETTFLGVACLTARETTERPVTVTQGTNRLVSITHLVPEALHALSRPPHRPSIPLWDGRASQRVVESLGRQVGITEAETLS
jgi:UDP-N-acetylglucosamine 2-epimerase (non-hydrolysing)